MKKLLTILLLTPFFSFGQITVTNIGYSSFSTGGFAGFSAPGGNGFIAGNLYIIFFGTSFTGGTPATVSLSGTSQTWTEIANVVNTTSNRRIQAFRYIPNTSHFNGVSVTYGGTGSQDGSFFWMAAVGGCVTTGTNGSDAILQYVTATDNSTIDPSLTLSALTNRSAVIASWIDDVNPFGPATPESGWTEGGENGYATPDTGGYYMYRIGSSDNTPSTSRGFFSNWAGIAIEIKAAGRRIFNTQ